MVEESGRVVETVGIEKIQLVVNVVIHIRRIRAVEMTCIKRVERDQ